MSSPKSPTITHLEWGVIEIEDGETTRRFKDAKLFPGGCRAWDWGETGTRHVPGIQPADVQELLDAGADVIVLSRGVHEKLQVCPETLTMLNDLEIEVHVLQTEEAVKLYNLFEDANRTVGGLFHSTC